MIVIAMLPLLPLALLFGGGGLFAWLALRKKKTAEPQKDGGREIGEGPAVKRVPELTLTAGRTKARLYRNGDVWAFVVDGPRPATATDKDAGKAAVDMAQSFASSVASEPDVPITGLATSTDKSVAFSVEPRNGRWDWSVTSVPEQPAAPELLAAGEESSRSRGVLQVLSSLTKLIDWLNVPAFEGSSAPSEPAISRLPGIVVTGNSLAVTSLPAWISYVAPFVREHLADGHSADQMMDAEIAGGEDLPPDTKLSGKSIAEVRSAVQKIVNEADNEAYRGAPPIDEKIAALMVGMDLTPDWLVEQHAGNVILVRPASAPAAGGGFGLNPGSVWEYLIWEGNQRGYDERARASKQLQAGKKKNDALNAAKKLIDDDFQEFDDGGNDSATVNPDWNQQEPPPDAGGWDPVPVDPIDLSKSVSMTLTSRWASDSTQDIVLFEVSSKNKRKDWTLDFGVCLSPKNKEPFGSLSKQRKDNVVVNYLRFQIRQAPPANAIGGVGSPLANSDWGDFDEPLTWKTQERIKFRRTLRETLRLAAPQKDIDGQTAAAVDPCPERSESWPMPDRPEGFIIERHTGGWAAWLPLPRLQVLVFGTKVVLRIKYRGLPVFVDREGAPSPAMDSAAFATKFKLEVKVRATGINSL